MSSPNPFADPPAGSNPYSSPAAEALPGNGANPLLLPAIFLLVSSAFSALYMVLMVAMVAAPQGPFSERNFDSVRIMMGLSYFVIGVLSLISMAGAIAMLLRKARWLAWAGSIVALVPLFGPCLGLTIPLAIWSILVLSRPDVGATFQS
jgi:hypothetical protein